ncbi:DUF3788 domain-containing protein [Faecalicoccus pleomorphus]|uniref:DUF3788 domain-containing protein n=1 Tax=Faecalicoccus pleomorphus TaxID=1323 RepID=UPI0026F0FA0D|nr:DUF3788 domain-containing protein [Faecalicoccus pleomorphus]
MIDIQDKSYIPSFDELAGYIQNPLFLDFCSDIKSKFCTKEQFDFSSCSWEYGWNVKFKKAGKNLYTFYPREGYFTVLIVIGKKQKEAVEAILSECSNALREIYYHTKEGNGQKWLMIDLEDKDRIYNDVFHLINIRKNNL